MGSSGVGSVAACSMADDILLKGATLALRKNRYEEYRRKRTHASKPKPKESNPGRPVLMNIDAERLPPRPSGDGLGSLVRVRERNEENSLNLGSAESVTCGPTSRESGLE